MQTSNHNSNTIEGLLSQLLTLQINYELRKDIKDLLELKKLIENNKDLILKHLTYFYNELCLKGDEFLLIFINKYCDVKTKVSEIELQSIKVSLLELLSKSSKKLLFKKYYLHDSRSNDNDSSLDVTKEYNKIFEFLLKDINFKELHAVQIKNILKYALNNLHFTILTKLIVADTVSLEMYGQLVEIAVNHEQYVMLDLLLEKVELKTPLPVTVVGKALINNYFNILNCCIKTGQLHPNTQMLGTDQTLLGLAIQNNQSKTVELLLQKGANADGVTIPLAIMEAATKHRYYNIITKCINDGQLSSASNVPVIGPEFADSDVTLLIFASTLKRQDIIGLLFKIEKDKREALIKEREQSVRSMKDAMVEAIKIGSISVMTKHLAEDKNKGTINDLVDGNNNMLCLACEEGQIGIIELLLKNGANIKCKNKSGRTPLMIAYIAENEAVFNTLIKHGEDINEVQADGMHHLELACLFSLEDTVKFLIDHGANVNLTNQMGADALQYACLKDQKLDEDIQKRVNIVKLLLDKNVNPNKCYPNLNGENLLYYTIKTNQPAVAKALIAAKANVNNKTNSNETPIFAACRSGDIELVKCLLANGAQLNIVSDANENPFQLAKQHSDIFKLLIKHDIKSALLMLDKQKDQVFIKAIRSELSQETIVEFCKAGNKEMLSVLIAHKIIQDANEFIIADKGQQKTLLSIAIESKQIEIVQWLINGIIVDVNKTVNGKTPLSLACEMHEEKIVELVLHSETLDESSLLLPLEMAFENEKESEDKPIVTCILKRMDDDAKEEAFANACRNSHIALAIDLLNSTTHLFTAKIDKMPVLHYLCKHNLPYLLAYYLIKASNAHNLKINALHKGETALTWACKQNNVASVNALICCKANINLNQPSTQTGITPLYYACQHNNLDMVQLLVKNGADVNKVTIESGRHTPLYAAFHTGNTALIQYLQDHGAHYAEDEVKEISQKEEDKKAKEIAYHQASLFSSANPGRKEFSTSAKKKVKTKSQALDDAAGQPNVDVSNVSNQITANAANQPEEPDQLITNPDQSSNNNNSVNQPKDDDDDACNEIGMDEVIKTRLLNLSDRYFNLLMDVFDPKQMTTITFNDITNLINQLNGLTNTGTASSHINFTIPKVSDDQLTLKAGLKKTSSSGVHPNNVKMLRKVLEEAGYTRENLAIIDKLRAKKRVLTTTCQMR